MQAAGYLVSSAAEFATGMQDRKYDLDRRNTGLMINTYRNTTAVINNGDRIIRIDHHFDFVAKSCQRLIDGIIYDLIYQMVKAP